MTDSKLAAADKPFSCLIVEDDGEFGAMAAQVVKGEGGICKLVTSIAAARESVATANYDLVLLDNHLPDGKGYDFFDQLAHRNPDAPVIMITGVPDLREAIALTRNGLFEYLTKPMEVAALVACLQRARLRMAASASATGDFDWFGDSLAMREIANQLRQASKHPATTVLLTGETGTGKDLAAQLLHRLTYPGKDAPFVPVNCAALPAEILESELFGAERGAYTGAEKRRAGLASSAAGGTLFLDEIAEVPLPLQAKFLRLLESREFRALGSTEPQQFTGRFVAATNKSLGDEVKAGRFREDLLYRLGVFVVELPPLKRRRSDIAGMAELLLGQLARKYNRDKPLLKPDDLSALLTHDFPGNARELRNILERSLLKTPDDSRWLCADLNWLQRAPAVFQADLAQTAANSEPLKRTLTPIEEQEYRLIRQTLGQNQGGIRRTAARLGMSPQALLRRLEKWPELRHEKAC